MTLGTITQLGPYQVRSLLGSGSMGEVYRALDSRLDREVALKVIRSKDSSEDVRRRFLQEARAVSALNHPNIVTIHDVGEEDGILYIVTEFLDGAPLRDAIRRGPLPMRTVLDLGIQIAAGLSAAHEAGIIHRDLKPENIMVTREGRAKILDFGIAKAVTDDVSELDATIGGNETAPGIVLGTAAYMSPEQARGGRISFWSDQFALGAILYEMTTGHSAFKRETGLQTLSAILMEEAPLLTQGSPAFQWLVKRCLHKEPDHRYASTQDVLRELQNIRSVMTDTISQAVEPDATFAEPSSEATVVIPAMVDLRQRDWFRYVWLLLLLLGTGVAGFLISRAVPQHSHAKLETKYRPFAVGPGLDVDPAWSPNGRALAYASEHNGIFQIFLRGLQSTAATQLTQLPDDCLAPFWSPDGARVYFLAAGSLWRVSAAGGSPEKIVDDVQSAAVSSDGVTLALLRRNSATGDVSLWTGPMRTRELKRYSEGPFGGAHFQVPAQLGFSPDGKHLAVWVSTTSAPEFWLLPWPGGAAQRMLTRAIAGTTAPRFSWQKDSRHIVYSARSHLWEAEVFRNTIHPLSAGAGAELTPSASRSSDSFAFAAAALDTDLVSIPLRGGAFRDESTSAMLESSPAVSPSGDLAFVTNRSGLEEIWLKNAGSDRPLVTPSSFGIVEDNRPYEFDNLSFSPDGRRLSYVRRDGSETAIWLSALTGDSPIRLASMQSGEAQTAPTWAPDGNSLAYSSKRKGVTVIMVARTGSLDPPTVIAENAGSEPLWSPSGKLIASLSPAGGLILLSPDGKVRRTVSSGTWLVHCWSKDGTKVYGIKRTAARSLFFTQVTVGDASESTISDMGAVPAGFAYAASIGERPFRGLVVAPNGESLLTSMMRARSDIWLLDRSK